MAFKSRSKADHTRLISKSIFITNFPDVTTSKDLWVLCQSYGTVVDVFIPNRMSKAGKRFAFVRFIKVDNVEKLVGNLCTLWIGRKHLQANVARFERDSIPSKRVPHKSNHVAPTPTSFVSAVNGVSSLPIPLASSPTLVLDDSCMVARDLDNFVMEEGEVMELEDGNEDLFARKRLCIKTKHANNILDSFKVVVKGKVFQIRAKELFVWYPSFKEVPEVVHCSDDESVKNEADINVVNNIVNNEEEESDSEAVSDTYFEDNRMHMNKIMKLIRHLMIRRFLRILSIFTIYLIGIIKKVGNFGTESGIPYPPGFTPEKELNSSNNCDFVKKAEVRWAIEGDENSKFFHGIINRMRVNLSVKGVMSEGEGVDDPIRVKDEFRNHFADRFNDPGMRHGRINFIFPNRLTLEQVSDLEASVSNEEIRKAVWGCGENKSPGPDGFTFEFFRKFWTVVGPNFCIDVKWFFEHGFFATGCNSSFVTLIPKTLDPKLVSKFRPISLIGSLYKVVTKILATRLSFVISDLNSNVQTAFLPNRQILDGPFTTNEILARCKHKNQQAMFFKVNFAKAYDSIQWDYLDDVLNAFGFGSRWRSWIQGSLNSGKASVLVNGSPTSKFQYRGLKQGDPLAPFLFILIMESLYLSFNRAVEAGIFTGLQIDDALTISHLFYADNVIFIGKWSKEKLKGILNILNCFSLLSGMTINLKKSHILGLGIRGSTVSEAAASLGCLVMKTPFNYLGIMVGGNMSLVKSWDETVHKLTKRISKWKLKTLSIGGRLTLLKSLISAIHESSTKDLSTAYPSTWNSIIKEFNYLKVQGVDVFSHCKIRIGNGLHT
nr:RNA-directed DNA polymerase, eukaryota [Tanacetum cinerariifolium]